VRNYFPPYRPIFKDRRSCTSFPPYALIFFTVTGFPLLKQTECSLYFVHIGVQLRAMSSLFSKHLLSAVPIERQTVVIVLTRDYADSSTPRCFSAERLHWLQHQVRTPCSRNSHLRWCRHLLGFWPTLDVPNGKQSLASTVFTVHQRIHK
jgi:hypothetical protein